MPVTKFKEYICVRCAVKFFALVHNKRKFCEQCAPEAAKDAERNQHFGRWLTEESKAYQREWGRAKTAAARSPKICIECGTQFDSKAYNVKRCAECREEFRHRRVLEHSKENLAFRRSQQPGLYIQRRRLSIRQRECCTNCGAQFDYSHELDHIVALGIGKRLHIVGLDDWDNLQFLCKQCHRLKTNLDVSLIAQIDKALKAERKCSVQ